MPGLFLLAVVRPSNISAGLKDEKISFAVVVCDTCNKADPLAHYKPQVAFHFPAGYPGTADVGKVEDPIGEVFTIENSSSGAGTQQSGT